MLNDLIRVRFSLCVCNNQLVNGKPLNEAQIYGGLVFSLTGREYLGQQKKLN